MTKTTRTSQDNSSFIFLGFGHRIFEEELRKEEAQIKRSSHLPKPQVARKVAELVQYLLGTAGKRFISIRQKISYRQDIENFLAARNEVQQFLTCKLDPNKPENLPTSNKICYMFSVVATTLYSEEESKATYIALYALQGYGMSNPSPEEALATLQRNMKGIPYAKIPGIKTDEEQKKIETYVEKISERFVKEIVNDKTSNSSTPISNEKEDTYNTMVKKIDEVDDKYISLLKKLSSDSILLKVALFPSKISPKAKKKKSLFGKTHTLFDPIVDAMKTAMKTDTEEQQMEPVEKEEPIQETS